MAAAATTAPHIGAKSPTIRRILREAAELFNSPSPDYTAEPLESDLFEWHFTIRGPPNSVYSQGIYHGRIVLPPAYPLRPPSFRFSTPSGRFEANREICLSISGHHEETWQPAWGIRTALVALRSFMETDARGQLGGLETTEPVRRRLAQESASFKCTVCAKTNADIIAECESRAKQLACVSQDVQVPAELNMSWRDEIEAAKTNGQLPSNDLSTNLPEPVPVEGLSHGPELAEGFVQTVPAVTGNSRGQTAFRMPASGIRQDHIRRPVQETRQDGSDGVPPWIDRAIVVLAVLLAALLMRILFGM